jgi:fatty-acyl-CoA synthase
MSGMGWIEVTSVGDLLRRGAQRRPSGGVVFPQERATTAELDELVDRFACGLLALGVTRGDHVGILLPQRLDYVAAFLGTSRIGAVPVPINARFKGAELHHVVPHAEISVLFVSGGGDEVVDYAALVADVIPLAPRLRHVVHLGPGAGEAFLDRAGFLGGGDSVDPAEVSRLASLVRMRDIAMIMYTSGTTAEPKGCLITQEAMVRQAQNYQERFELGPEDAYWDPLPLFHIGGIIPLLACLDIGCRYCHPGQFDPGQALRTLEQERCTVAMPVFDTIWLDVLNHPDYPATDLSALRVLLLLGTPESLRLTQARMPGVAQISGSGSTESCANLVLGSARDPLEKRLTTCGKLMGGMEIRITDPETGGELGAGESGELLFRGVGRFEGYYKEPGLTATMIDSDGWYHSGDLASMSADGYLSYEGRLKDALKVGGENVSPLEVEDFIRAHAAVSIVSVVGAPDERYGEVVTAFIELNPGAAASEEEIIEFCMDRIATFKIPRYVRFVSEWPMSGTKIAKRMLRDQITDELRVAGIRRAPPIRRPAASGR